MTAGGRLGQLGVEIERAVEEGVRRDWRFRSTQSGQWFQLSVAPIAAPKEQEEG